MARLAYARTAAALHRRHDPTYYWATRRLPARRAARRCTPCTRSCARPTRSSTAPAAPPTRRCAAPSSTATSSACASALAGEATRDPAVTALVDAGRRHDLPLEQLDSYFDSMRIDCAPVRMGSWEELESYMQGSAGAVGRILAVLLGAPADRHDSFASLALAFQLTNFIRDVREDWELDRVYLPGCARREQIARRQPTAGFRRLLARRGRASARAVPRGRRRRATSWRRGCGAG